MKVTNLQIQCHCHFWISTKYMKGKCCNLTSPFLLEEIITFLLLLFSLIFFKTFILESIIWLSSSDTKSNCQWCLRLVPPFDNIWRSALSIHHFCDMLVRVREWYSLLKNKSFVYFRT